MEVQKGKVNKMDGSDNWVSSSSTPNRSPSRSPPKGMGENSQTNEEMRPIVQKQKKHIMSPTVSAASKANPLRKKILAERNDLGTTPLQSTQNLDSRTSSGSEFGVNQKNSLADGLSASSPYDPLTNYLSPRPKFLRYKPKRKQEIILRRENEIKEGNCSPSVSGEEDSSSSCGSLITDYPVGNLNQQDRETDDCDEEIEEWVEEEEKGCWGSRGVLKFLLLFVVLVLSTSYISSVNSPNPSRVVQAVEGLKNGYHMIHDHVYGFVKSLEGRNHSLVETLGTEMSFAYLDRIGVEMIEDVKMEGVENGDWLIEGKGIQSKDREFTKCAESEAIDFLEYEDSGATGKLGDIQEVQGEESKLVGEGIQSEDGEYSACAKSEAMDIVEYEDSGATEKLGDIVEVQGEESKLISNPKMVEREEVFDNVEMNYDAEGLVGFEITESPFMVDGVNRQGIILFNLENMTYDRENEAGSESQELEVISNEMGATDAANDSEEHEALIDEAESSFDMMHFLYQGMFISCVAGLITSVLTYLILSFLDFINSKRNRTARKHSTSRNVESCSELVVEQKCDSAHVNKEDKHIEHPVSIENSRSLVHSMEEDPEEANQSCRVLPSIELLGEFVVEGMSSSLGSHDMKSRMVESEVSSYYVLKDKGADDKAHSVPGQLQPALSEISIMDSPSYGRFTDEKTAVKNQKGRAEDRKVVITTPVRRSSRIRDRIASP